MEARPKVLVFGGAGYIGAHCVRELVDDGWDVTVFDDFSSGCRCNVLPDTKLIEGDILDYELVLKTMREGCFMSIFHLAAKKAVGESMEQPEKYSRNNLCGSINILNAACATGIRNIIFSSTAALYGEPQYVPVDEAHPVCPTNFYGFTKLQIEELLEWYSRLKGVNFAALRYFNAIGYDPCGRVCGLERNPQNLAPIILEVAAGVREVLEIFGGDWETRDGTCLRDYVHVSDLARAHVSALRWISDPSRLSEPSQGGRAGRGVRLLVNLGTENGFTVREMLEAARRVTGKPIPARVVGRRAGDTAVVLSSSSRAFEILGWKSEIVDADRMFQTMWPLYQRLT